MSSVYPVNEQCIKTVSFCYGDVLCGFIFALNIFSPTSLTTGMMQIHWKKYGLSDCI